MAKANVGSMNIKITGDASQLDAVFKSTAANAQAFGLKIDKAGNSTKLLTQKSKRNSRALLELSRGVEDAAVVYGTTGLSGAIRASSNNMSQMMSIMSPMLGMITGFGVAILSLVLPALTAWATKSDDAADAMGRHTREIEKQRAAQEKKRNEDEKAAQVFIDAEDAAKKRAKALRSGKVSELESELQTEDRAIVMQKKLVGTKGGRGLTRELSEAQGIVNKMLLDETNKLIKKWQDEMSKSEERRGGFTSLTSPWMHVSPDAPLAGSSINRQPSKKEMDEIKKQAEKNLRGLDATKPSMLFRPVDYFRDVFSDPKTREPGKFKKAQEAAIKAARELRKIQGELKLAEDRRLIVHKALVIAKAKQLKKDKEAREETYRMFEISQELSRLRKLKSRGASKGEPLSGQQIGGQEAQTTILRALGKTVDRSTVGLLEDIKKLNEERNAILRKRAQMRLLNI